jgi:hypothetical protein
MINKRLGLTKCYALMRSEISLRLFTYSFSGSLYLSLNIYSINPINYLFIYLFFYLLKDNLNFDHLLI